MSGPDQSVRSGFHRLRGKWHAARTLLAFARALENWPDVWAAYKDRRQPPPLRLRGGVTITHGPADDTYNLFREVFLDHCYTRRGFYRPKAGDTVLDLGANVGFFALYLQSRARGVRVHCFEPGPQAVGALRHNVAANGLDAFVTVHPYAVTDRRRTARLEPAALLAQRSLFPSEFSDPSAAGDEVECVSLADAVEMAGAPRVALLKMDIEGAEVEAVAGAPRAVWDRVDRVAFEYHDRFRPGCRARVVEALRGQGFRRFDEPRDAYQLNDVGIVLAGR
jgi:FkbM family methyltransferase